MEWNGNEWYRGILLLKVGRLDCNIFFFVFGLVNDNGG